MKSKAFKVLIFAHDFPPLTSIGAMRPESWYNYFKGYGLYPIIVTRNWGSKPNSYLDYYRVSNTNIAEIEETEQGTIIKAPFRPNLRDRLIVKNKFSFFRKFLSFIMEFTKYRSFIGDNTRELYHEADKYLDNNKIDFILATGEPWVCFRYAHLLSKKYNIPWSSDYRDGWNTDVSMNDIPRLLKKYYLGVRGSIEKKYAKSATFISVSDPDILKKNIEYLGVGNHKYINPLNGYDNEKIDSLSKIKQSHDVFKIGYAGTIYSFQRVDLFLDGLAKFVNQYSLTPKDLKVLFIGSEYYSDQKNRILNHNMEISDFLTTTPRMSHLKSLTELKSCNLLLLLCNDEFVALPAKIFEYFGLERKILVVKNDKNVVENFILETKGGDLCNDSEDVFKSLCANYNLFLKNKKIENKIDDKEKYSRRTQAKKIVDEILHRLK